MGLNSSLFGDRVNINFDYYRGTTDDMLIDVSLPPSSGANSVRRTTSASSAANGIEFSLYGARSSGHATGAGTSRSAASTPRPPILNISDALQAQKREIASQVNRQSGPWPVVSSTANRLTCHHLLRRVPCRYRPYLRKEIHQEKHTKVPGEYDTPTVSLRIPNLTSVNISLPVNRRTS